MNEGGEFWARPVKPFGRGRSWLRWTRALCKFNGGKQRRCSCAETVLQDTTHNTVRAEIGYGEKGSQRLWSKKLEEGIGLTARHRDPKRPEGRRVFELERVVSCRNADRWWETKLDFGSGESLDDLHRSTAFRAPPKIGTVFGGSGRGVLLFCLRLLFRTQQLKAKR